MSNKGRKTYVSPTPQPDDLDLLGFKAIEDWVEIKKVGNIGETGTQTNILSYDTMDTGFSDKEKGISNAGDPTIECRYVPTDPGQIKAEELALTNMKYAFKFEYNDKLTTGGTGTIEYNRGIITGPTIPNGGVEDFPLRVFTLGLVQQNVIVPAT